MVDCRQQPTQLAQNRTSRPCLHRHIQNPGLYTNLTGVSSALRGFMKQLLSKAQDDEPHRKRIGGSSSRHVCNSDPVGSTNACRTQCADHRILLPHHAFLIIGMYKTQNRSIHWLYSMHCGHARVMCETFKILQNATFGTRPPGLHRNIKSVNQRSSYSLVVCTALCQSEGILEFGER